MGLCLCSLLPAKVTIAKVIIYKPFEGKVHIFWEGHINLQNLRLTFDCIYCSQKLGEDISKFCGLLRIYELYSKAMRKAASRSVGLLVTQVWIGSKQFSVKWIFSWIFKEFMQIFDILRFCWHSTQIASEFYRPINVVSWYSFFLRNQKQRNSVTWGQYCL